MIAIASLVIVVSLALLITRLAALAQAATGVAADVARFQARSAFTGVGFTTSVKPSSVIRCKASMLGSWVPGAARQS
jgi:hypothetical protein